jgi:hypothetical protein
MAAISARYPEMTLVVAHDPRSFASIPAIDGGRPSTCCWP